MESDREAFVEGTIMRAWRWLLMPLATVALSGCGGDGSGYTSVYDHARFYPDDWVYYDDDDEVFLAGLTDEQKDELKRRWDALSPEERAQIRDRWSQLSDGQRAQVRQAWDRLDLGQREQVLSSMDARVRNGTLRPVMPAQARAGGFGGSLGGGGFGGGRGGRR